MQIPLLISFRGISRSDALENAIRKRADHLDHLHDSIISCRVLVELPHRRHRTGSLFHVRVEVTVPGADLVVSRDPANHKAHMDAYLCIHDAFDAAERELKKYAERRRTEVKRHDVPPHGWITRIVREDGGYGFLRDQSGQEYYFHRNSVLHGLFDELEIGTEVRFAGERGELGPQASTVEILGREAKHFIRSA